MIVNRARDHSDTDYRMADVEVTLVTWVFFPIAQELAVYIIDCSFSQIFQCFSYSIITVRCLQLTALISAILKEWPEETYPPWAHGPGYVVSHDIANAVSQRHQSGHLKVSDRLMTNTSFRSHI